MTGFSSDDLHLHADTMRRLARDLLPDCSLADDAVQQAYVTAIERPPVRTSGLAGWLLSIVRSCAIDLQRSEARRRAREQTVAEDGDDTSVTPTQTAERFEVQAAIVAAVRGLGEPYTTTLWLRYYEDLSPTEIAVRLGDPVKTIKTRLWRALHQLRMRLDEGSGGRPAWLAAIAPIAQVSLATDLGAASAAGVLFMQGKMIVAAAAAILVATGALLWWSSPMTEATGTAAASITPAAAADVAPPSSGPTTAPTPSMQASESGEGHRSRRTEVATTGSLVVHAVWEDDVPAAFVTLNATCKGPAPSSLATTNAKGHGHFENLAPGDYTLFAPRTTQGTKVSHVEIRAGEESAQKIVLGGDLRLRVTVVDADGVPRRRAAVWVEDRYDQDEVYRQIGSTDTAGALLWRGLPVSQVFARSGGNEPSVVHVLPQFTAADVPREPIAVQLTLGPRSCTVTGTVVDPQGRPAARARVAIACDDSIRAERNELLVRADAQGHFYCDEVPAGERTIVASLPEFAPVTQRITTSVNEPTNVHLQLRTGVTLAGRVVDADNKPVANVQVYTRGAGITLGLRSPWGQHVHGRTDKEGRYELRTIAPGRFTASVQIQPEIKRSFKAHDGERVTWDAVAEPERAIVGVVVDSDDTPLARWRVTALPPPRMRGVSPREHSTDAQGRFRIRSLVDAPYRVFVFGPRSDGDSYRSAANSVSALIVNDVRPSAESRTFRVPADAMPTAWIEGSLALPDGIRAAATLSLYPKLMQGRGGFMVPQERLAAGTTTFRIGPLPSGEYQLLCDIEGRGRLTLDGVRLAANETRLLSPFAFDKQRPQVIVLRHADGRAATGGTIKLKSTLMPYRETAPGRYESMPVAEGPDEVLVRGPDFAPASLPVMCNATSTPIELTVTTATPVVVRLTPPTPRDRWVGALTVRVTDATGAVLIREMLQLDGGADFRVPLGLAPGKYSLAFLLHGAGRADTTATVGVEPLQIDLQIMK